MVKLENMGYLDYYRAAERMGYTIHDLEKAGGISEKEGMTVFEKSLYTDNPFKMTYDKFAEVAGFDRVGCWSVFAQTDGHTLKVKYRKGFESLSKSFIEGVVNGVYHVTREGAECNKKSRKRA